MAQFEKLTAPSQGTPIRFENGQPVVADNPIIPFIRGDGTGVDIWPATQKVLDAAVAKAYGGAKTIEWFKVYAGDEACDLYGTYQYLPEDTLEAIRTYGVAIKGPLTTPVGGGIRSLNVALRQIFDLYSCVRPCRYYEGTPSPHKRPQDLDVIVGHALPGPVMVLDNRTEPISAGGDGVIRFEPPQQIANDSFFRGLAVADLDGDCDLDVLAVELVSNSLWVLPNLTPQASGCGDGFVGRVAAPVDSRVSSVSPGVDRAQVADLDGDGVVSGADIALFLTRMRSGETPRGEPVRGPIESRRR